MEKEANTVTKSPLQSLSLPDCQGKERREPRMCTGGSLKAQTKKKKGRLMSGDHGRRTSHLHAGVRLLSTCGCLSLETGSTQEEGGSWVQDTCQAGRRRGEHCQNLPPAEWLGQARLPDRFTWFVLPRKSSEVTKRRREVLSTTTS